MASTGKVQRLEEVLVGVFGAVIGAEVVKAVLLGPNAGAGVSAGGLGAAVAGAVLLLVLLRLMRGAVGPLRSGRSPGANRRR